MRDRLGYVREAVMPAFRRPLAEPDYCVSVDTPLGRYWIPFLQPLTARGGSVAVLGSFPGQDYGNPDAPGAAPVRLPGVRFSFAAPRRTSATTLLAESSRRRLDRRGWAKRLRFSLAAYDELDGAEPFYRLPFGIHPGFTARGWGDLFTAQRSTERTTRILFAGNTDPRAYETGLARARKAQYGIELTRSEAVNVLQDGLGADELVVADWDADDLPRLFDGSCRDKFFMARWNAYRDRQWPRALGAADFFLALPGVVLPFAHNIAESMAAGCIPITNYANWFLPRLEDGRNCLAFGDAASLVAAVEQALAMPPVDVERLRANVLDYYDSHLAPETVPDALDALPDGATVYLVSEHAEPLAKVRSGSIAFPGPGP